MTDILISNKDIDGNYLNSLVINNKYIKNDDWTKINFYLNTNNTIKSIELSGVRLDQYGLTQLGEIVCSNDIKELKLEWNDFSEIINEIEYLTECLIKSNVTLLYLNNNKLNHLHINAICKLIKHSSQINFIDLRWNEFNDDCIKNFCEAIKKNTTLQYLNLVGNKLVNNSILKEINDLLFRNKTFQENLIGKKDNLKKSQSQFDFGNIESKNLNRQHEG